MSEQKDHITELQTEIARLKSELEKSRERERNMDETRRAMLFMLEDLERSQESLSRAKNEWEATFDGISDPLFVHDRDLKIVRANRAYATAAGMDIKEITGKPYYEIFPKMEKPFKICLKALELREEEEEEEEEFSYPIANRIFKVRFYPIKDVNGGYLYSIHILEDITEAKRASEKIQEAEARYHLLFEQSPAGVVIYDPKTLLPIEFNDQMCNQLGYSREEFSRLPIPAYEAVETPEEIKEHADKVLREGQDTFERRHKTKAGDIRNVLISVKLINLSGKVLLYCIIRDITEIKMAEEMLQRTHRRLSTLYNIDRSISHSLDLNEILKDGLSMTLKTLEIEGGAVTLIDPDGKTMTIRIHKGLSEEFVNIVRHVNIDEGISGRAIAGRKPVILNVSEYPTERLAPFIIKEGFQTLASTPLISAGKVFGAVTLVTDKIKTFPPEEIELLTSIGIQLGTAVQNALLYQSMMISEERYRGLVETSADAIVSVNDAREIVQWNESASKVFGYSKDEIMGKLIDTIVPEEYQDRHIKGFKRYIETGEGKIIGKTAELKGLRKDGFIVHVELSLSVLRAGESYIFTGIIRDLTERKRVEQESIQQQKLATMGHLISGITHEIKNPLNIISGNVQILNMEEQDTEKKKIYGIVLQQVDRSVKIIDNLLGFARRREYEIKDIDINNLIESTIRLVEYEMKLENIIFIRDFKKDLPLIKGDADQLAQVFLNLINNARDSMNEKQKRIRSGKLKAEGWKGEIKITAKKTDNMIEINFADTGLGIPEDKAANVFKPFFTTKAEGKGTGLGLSIAKDIIGKHGGKIELENKAGEGVKFIIMLSC
ncbi:MAG: PAS domain S-box protein [Nitrospinae bacterium]|nr:PAS domain S-box protein [Nitrospinota bacterium]